MTSAEESKLKRCVAEAHDYSAIQLLVCHKASNGLIRYGNGPSDITIGKGFKDIYV